MNNICLEGDIPKDSMVAHVIKTGLPDLMNHVKDIPNMCNYQWQKNFTCSCFAG